MSPAMSRPCSALGLCLALLAGCSSGHANVATKSSDLGLFKIESGLYTVANLATAGDGCQLDLASGSGGGSFTMLSVNNDGNGGVALGSYHGTGGSPPLFMPSAYTGGNGHFSDDTHGTTLTQTHVITAVDAGADSCNYDVTISTVLTVTGNDRLHVALTHRDANITDCTTPPGSSCTSNWTFDLSLTPPADLATTD